MSTNNYTVIDFYNTPIFFYPYLESYLEIGLIAGNLVTTTIFAAIIAKNRTIHFHLKLIFIFLIGCTYGYDIAM